MNHNQENQEAVEFRRAPWSLWQKLWRVCVSALCLSGLWLYFPDLVKKLMSSIQWRIGDLQSGNLFSIGFDSFCLASIFLMLCLISQTPPVSWLRENKGLALVVCIVGIWVCTNLFPFFVCFFYGIFIWIVHWRSSSWSYRIERTGLRLTEGYLSPKSEFISWSAIKSCRSEDVDGAGSGDIVLQLATTERPLSDIARAERLCGQIRKALTPFPEL
ncbi:MAG: hypothetical protein RL095_1919 [Verrucomicrobiota bacterium]|jgi:magnesium-transporting ATPase (P-type)